MGTMLDVIGSIVIRGAIMLALINLTIQMNTALYQKTALASTRQSTVIPVQIMCDDIYRAKTSVFEKAKLNEIKFSAGDINDNSETVYYYLEGATSAKGLYRQVSSINNNTPALIAHNVTNMTFEYYDLDGVAKSPGENVGGIKSIKLKLTIQTDNNSGSTFWEKNIFPPNI
jgi:hypothetical protein